ASANRSRSDESPVRSSAWFSGDRRPDFPPNWWQQRKTPKAGGRPTATLPFPAASSRPTATLERPPGFSYRLYWSRLIVTWGDVGKGLIFDAEATVDVATPLSIGERRPVVRIEAGAVLEDVRTQVENDLASVTVDSEQLPRNGEQLLSQTADSTAGENGISDPSFFQVDHEVFQASQPLPFPIHALIALERRRRQHRGRHTVPSVGVTLPGATRSVSASRRRSARAASTR